MLVKILKVILPNTMLAWIISKKNMFRAFKYDFQRYSVYSRSNGNNSPEKLLGQIITIYHVIEKGLTMPNPRLGFGKERIIQLCELCIQYIDGYGSEEEQLTHAIQVVLEYKEFHRNKFKLEAAILAAMEKLEHKQISLLPSKQKEITKSDFFYNRYENFYEFSNSRASVRNFSSENIPMKKIIEVLELAKNTPSACNRQSWRTYSFSEKNQIEKILDAQGGNRGFGHLANKIIVVAGELGVFEGVAERNQVFIDGGIYSMNLLYCLHYYGIAACILNCSHGPEKDKIMRNLCKIKESEVFVSIVICGIPPESFMIANSQRHNLKKTNINR
ncbi:nitroreductase family protein [Marinifilum sp. RC60d5]|uniref:nitroreductase family protein n=1 Tax=Marinifilum sp. RC60d5 TaxID=3458414 RepID=UPI004035A32F